MGFFKAVDTGSHLSPTNPLSGLRQLTLHSTMRYPPPANVFLGFPPPPNGSHLPTHGSQPWVMGSDNLVHPGSSQPANSSTASGIQNPYTYPVVPNQRLPDNTLGTSSQPDSSYFGLTPSRSLAGITRPPYFPSMGFPHGSNYISVINFESPTRPKSNQETKASSKHCLISEAQIIIAKQQLSLVNESSHLLSSTTIEKLQISKYLYHRERLNFTAGMVAVEEDYVIDGPVTELAIHELLKAGKEGELRDLYTNWTIDSNYQLVRNSSDTELGVVTTQLSSAQLRNNTTGSLIHATTHWYPPNIKDVQGENLNPESVKLNPNATVPILTHDRISFTSTVEVINYLVSISQKKIAPETSITSVVHEEGIDPNFTLGVARNDEELAAVSNSFVTTFTKTHLAGSDVDVYPLSLLPSSPGLGHLKKYAATPEGQAYKPLYNARIIKISETLRTSTALWDDIQGFIVVALLAAIDRGPFIAGAESEADDFHVAEWLAGIAYVVCVQKSDEGVSALEKRFRPIPHKIECNAMSTLPPPGKCKFNGSPGAGGLHFQDPRAEYHDVTTSAP
ncbi:hypothetical protein BC827DRAFT_1157222 [Russula dissimulans]|nr:hypothetical protein BC827DRAFT_1157222 [Russula dissimulans]